MPTREATCHCGALRVVTTGDPFAVSVCHCEACQRRTGSAFGMQAGFARDQVAITGAEHVFTRVSDEADAREHVFHFCPSCGSTVFFTEPDDPGLVVVAVGAFADPAFPPPTEAGYDHRRHAWLELPDTVRTAPRSAWEELHPLYARGDLAEAAERGRALVATHPDDARLAYNVACCESRTGDAARALEHLAQAIAVHPPLAALARGDDDLALLRDDPAFVALVTPRG
jgi:hypothetical protein